MGKTRSSFWYFVLPGLSIYAVFFLLPIVQALWYSFYQWPGFGSGKFIGLENYITLMSDSILMISLTNSLIFMLLSFAIMLPFSFLLANSIASLSPSRSAAFYSIVIFMPCIVASVAVGQMWETILNRNYGIISYLMESFFGTKGPNWLGDMNLSIYTIIFVNTWQWMGLSTLIFSAAIKNVPKELYDASKIDGAGPLQQFIWVTVPMTSKTIMVNMLIMAFGTLRAFDLVFILTAGGPLDSSQMPAHYMYYQTFKYLEFGPGSAIAVLILILAIFSYIGIRIIFLIIPIISSTKVKINQYQHVKFKKGLNSET